MSGLNLSPQMMIESSSSRKQYRLLEVLGAGGFGQVWLTSDNSSGNLRAVKVMQDSNLTNIMPELEQMQAALKAAGNAYVPDVYEASVGRACIHGAQPEFCMIVMEYIDGVDAWRLSKASEMPEYAVRIIIAQTCRALCRLHEHGIVHRDIKGANILVSMDAEVKVCDFGISTHLSNDKDLRQLAGTAAYMAPEICAVGVGSDHYDEKVDVWAVGILGIDLAMGFVPGDGRRDQLRMIYTSTRDVPDVLRPSGFSVDFQQMAKSCLQRDSLKRPSAAELLTFRCMHVSVADFQDFRAWVQEAIEDVREDS